MSDRKSVTREDLSEAIKPVTRVLNIGGGDKGYDRWLEQTTAAIFDALPATPPASEGVTGADERVAALREAVETEWYNGNMDECARDRILALDAAPEDAHKP